MMRRKEKKSFRESTWMNRTIWALWVFAFGVLYMIHGNDAAAAAVLMALIYPAVALLSVNLSGRRLKVEFGGGGSAEKSRDIPMEIRLKNESRIPVSRLRFRIQMENRITGEEQSISAAVSLGSGGEAVERFTICDPYCGCERIRIRDAEICDGAGLAARHIRLEEYTDAVVLPSIETIGIPEHFLDSYDMESYHYSSRRPGEDPGEVFGIREYQSGDSLRAVHWKLSAKMNDLMVKIPSFPIENSLILLLDNEEDPESALPPESRSALMDLYASLSGTLAEKRIRHTLGWYDAGEGVFETREIARIEDLWEALPHVLSAPFSGDGISTVFRFLELGDRRKFSNHFFVTAQAERDIGKLERYGAVKIFRSR